MGPSKDRLEPHSIVHANEREVACYTRLFRLPARLLMAGRDGDQQLPRHWNRRSLVACRDWSKVGPTQIVGKSISVLWIPTSQHSCRRWLRSAALKTWLTGVGPAAAVLADSNPHRRHYLAFKSSHLHTVQMNGKAVYAHAVRSMAASCQATLQANGVSASDVDLVIAHQTNLRILEAVAEGTGLALERFHLSIERYGNKRW